ncbi:uncharacterized protein AMSG_06070 [Thecamonas trahens ATCC 50062]|uniref:Fibronectin type-III domain-containing protein n=1 Tax=Thecamonas trahens ATCC 50062 TaxID=461836 RepID=A0A0L0DCH2_THETB|nr:hypothetical protein AMSG_06070 [Thecamonas trahens ATCC 50062]KNC49791.1 hypothetical protein AMSG_06070 [Thecamonas trahens ATCC 50062]|eukprot:XP_013757575.1 hypothetical protein AMSG_06070 [Thecamonas trahens ATCC 50062]
MRRRWKVGEVVMAAAVALLVVAPVLLSLVPGAEGCPSSVDFVPATAVSITEGGSSSLVVTVSAPGAGCSPATPCTFSLYFANASHPSGASQVASVVETAADNADMAITFPLGTNGTYNATATVVVAPSLVVCGPSPPRDIVVLPRPLPSLVLARNATIAGDAVDATATFAGRGSLPAQFIWFVRRAATPGPLTIVGSRALWPAATATAAVVVGESLLDAPGGVPQATPFDVYVLVRNAEGGESHLVQAPGTLTVVPQPSGSPVWAACLASVDSSVGVAAVGLGATPPFRIRYSVVRLADSALLAAVDVVGVANDTVSNASIALTSAMLLDPTAPITVRLFLDVIDSSGLGAPTATIAPCDLVVNPAPSFVWTSDGGNGLVSTAAADASPLVARLATATSAASWPVSYAWTLNATVIGAAGVVKAGWGTLSAGSGSFDSASASVGITVGISAAAFADAAAMAMLGGTSCALAIEPIAAFSDSAGVGGSARGPTFVLHAPLTVVGALAPLILAPGSVVSRGVVASAVWNVSASIAGGTLPLTAGRRLVQALPAPSAPLTGFSSVLLGSNATRSLPVSLLDSGSVSSSVESFFVEWQVCDAATACISLSSPAVMVVPVPVATVATAVASAGPGASGEFRSPMAVSVQVDVAPVNGGVLPFNISISLLPTSASVPSGCVFTHLAPSVASRSLVLVNVTGALEQLDCPIGTEWATVVQVTDASGASASATAALALVLGGPPVVVNATLSPNELVSVGAILGAEAAVWGGVGTVCVTYVLVSGADVGVVVDGPWQACGPSPSSLALPLSPLSTATLEAAFGSGSTAPGAANMSLAVAVTRVGDAASTVATTLVTSAVVVVHPPSGVIVPSAGLATVTDVLEQVCVTSVTGGVPPYSSTEWQVNGQAVGSFVHSSSELCARNLSLIWPGAETGSLAPGGASSVALPLSVTVTDVHGRASAVSTLIQVAPRPLPGTVRIRDRASVRDANLTVEVLGVRGGVGPNVTMMTSLEALATDGAWAPLAVPDIAWQPRGGAGLLLAVSAGVVVDAGAAIAQQVDLSSIKVAGLVAPHLSGPTNATRIRAVVWLVDASGVAGPSLTTEAADYATATLPFPPPPFFPPPSPPPPVLQPPPPLPPPPPNSTATGAAGLVPASANNSDGWPLWLILVVCGSILLCCCLILLCAFLVLRRARSQRDEATAEFSGDVERDQIIRDEGGVGKDDAIPHIFAFEREVSCTALGAEIEHDFDCRPRSTGMESDNAVIDFATPGQLPPDEVSDAELSLSTSELGLETGLDAGPSLFLGDATVLEAQSGGRAGTRRRRKAEGRVSGHGSSSSQADSVTGDDRSRVRRRRKAKGRVSGHGSSSSQADFVTGDDRTRVRRRRKAKGRASGHGSSSSQADSVTGDDRTRVRRQRGYVPSSLVVGADEVDTIVGPAFQNSIAVVLDLPADRRHRWRTMLDAAAADVLDLLALRPQLAETPTALRFVVPEQVPDSMLLSSRLATVAGELAKAGGPQIKLVKAADGAGLDACAARTLAISGRARQGGMARAAARSARSDAAARVAGTHMVRVATGGSSVEFVLNLPVDASASVLLAWADELAVADAEPGAAASASPPPAAAPAASHTASHPPTEVFFQIVTPSSIMLRWVPPRAGGPYSMFRVYRGLALAHESPGTFLFDDDLAPNTLYEYRVCGRGRDGLWSAASPPFRERTRAE